VLAGETRCPDRSTDSPPAAPALAARLVAVRLSVFDPRIAAQKHACLQTAKQKAKIPSFSRSLPRPPQTPAAPFKRAYRKCRLGDRGCYIPIREGGTSDKS
jgi:hypothetical protein